MIKSNPGYIGVSLAPAMLLDIYVSTKLGHWDESSINSEFYSPNNYCLTTTAQEVAFREGTELEDLWWEAIELQERTHSTQLTVAQTKGNPQGGISHILIYYLAYLYTLFLKLLFLSILYSVKSEML